MKAVVLYPVGPGFDLDLATRLFPEHKAWYEQFAARGELLMIGPFANREEGAMSVFKDRESAERFVAGDPFVLRGVISGWSVREWDEALVK